MVSKGRAVAGHGGALRGTGRYLNGLGVLVAGAGVRVLEGDLLILAAHARSAVGFWIVFSQWGRPGRGRGSAD